MSLQRALSWRVIHTGGLIIIGSLMVFHIALTPVIFKQLSGTLIWYIGIDLCRAFQIMLNLAAVSVAPEHRTPWRLAHVANALCIGLDVLNFAAVPEPINVLVILGTLMIAAGLARRDREPVFGR